MDYSQGTVKQIQKWRKAGNKGKEFILSGLYGLKHLLTQIVNRKLRTSVNKVDYISNQYILV